MYKDYASAFLPSVHLSLTFGKYCHVVSHLVQMFIDLDEKFIHPYQYTT